MVILMLSGVGASVVAAVLLRAWARQRGIAKKVGTPLRPEARSLPPIGGLAFAVGCTAALVSWQTQAGVVWSDKAIGLLAAGAVILLVGLVDDFVRELAPWQKLLGQVIAWLFLVRGGIMTYIVALPPWANLLVSLLWTLALINAFNLLDIADGLAGGIALIASVTLLILSLQAGQVVVAGSLAVIIGALAGVLVFNWPRASLFLGDSGSMLLGLLLAALSLAISYAPLGREIALLTPLLVLGLPLYDLGFVTIMRMRQGRPLFRKSPDHFVFRLMRQGYSATKAIVVMYLLALAFSLTALIVSTSSNAVGTVLVAAVIAVALWWAVRMAKVPVNA
jgi:UDP-GlcNAc:undecaprenyl-phosphate GlcNAc-1-phosphate transferase